jgi:hypothetical protein
MEDEPGEVSESSQAQEEESKQPLPTSPVQGGNKSDIVQEALNLFDSNERQGFVVVECRSPGCLSFKPTLVSFRKSNRKTKETTPVQLTIPKKIRDKFTHHEKNQHRSLFAQWYEFKKDALAAIDPDSSKDGASPAGKKKRSHRAATGTTPSPQQQRRRQPAAISSAAHAQPLIGSVPNTSPQVGISVPTPLPPATQQWQHSQVSLGLPWSSPASGVHSGRTHPERHQRNSGGDGSREVVAAAASIGGSASFDVLPTDADIQNLPPEYFKNSPLVGCYSQSNFQLPALAMETQMLFERFEHALLTKATIIHGITNRNKGLAKYLRNTSDSSQSEWIFMRHMTYHDDATPLTRAFIGGLYFHLVVNASQPHPSILPVYGIYKFHDFKTSCNIWYEISPKLEYGSLSQWQARIRPDKDAVAAELSTYCRRVMKVALQIAEGMEYLHQKGYFIYLFMSSVLMDEGDKVQLRGLEHVVHLDTPISEKECLIRDLQPSGPQCPEHLDRTPWTSSLPPRSLRTHWLEKRNVFEFGMFINLLLHPHKTPEEMRLEILVPYLKENHEAEQKRMLQEKLQDVQNQASATKLNMLYMNCDQFSDKPYLCALQAGYRPDIAGLHPPVVKLLQDCWQTDRQDRPDWNSIISELKAYLHSDPDSLQEEEEGAAATAGAASHPSSSVPAAR